MLTKRNPCRHDSTSANQRQCKLLLSIFHLPLRLWFHDHFCGLSTNLSSPDALPLTCASDILGFSIKLLLPEKNPRKHSLFQSIRPPSLLSNSTNPQCCKTSKTEQLERTVIRLGATSVVSPPNRKTDWVSCVPPPPPDIFTQVLACCSLLHKPYSTGYVSLLFPLLFISQYSRLAINYLLNPFLIKLPRHLLCQPQPVTAL